MSDETTNTAPTQAELDDLQAKYDALYEDHEKVMDKVDDLMNQIGDLEDQLEEAKKGGDLKEKHGRARKALHGIIGRLESFDNRDYNLAQDIRAQMKDLLED